MSKNKKTYVFDIDNTICKTSDSKYEKSTPIQERIDVVNLLYDQGHEIIFQTARGMGRTNNSAIRCYKYFYELTKSQLKEWGVKHHDLFMGKVAGDIYIDDKGIADDVFFNRHSRGPDRCL